MWLAMFGCLLVAAMSAVGHAQAAPDDQLLRDALAAYERGELETADALLQTVHKNDPSARTLRGLGIVAFQRGRYRQALGLLEQSLQHPELPLGEALRASVRELIAECKSRLGRIRLDVSPGDAELWIDGEPFAYESGTPLTLEVGGHELVLRREGFRERILSVAVAATSELPLAVQLDALAAPGAAAAELVTLVPGHVAQEADAAPVEPRHPGKRPRLVRTGAIALGLALAAAGVGVTSMVLAKQRVGEVQRACQELPAHRCSAAEASRKEEDANLPVLSQLATGGFIAGGALLATGLGVLLALPANPGAPRAWSVSASGRF